MSGKNVLLNTILQCTVILALCMHLCTIRFTMAHTIPVQYVSKYLLDCHVCNNAYSTRPRKKRFGKKSWKHACPYFCTFVYILAARKSAVDSTQWNFTCICRWLCWWLCKLVFMHSVFSLHYAAAWLCRHFTYANTAKQLHSLLQYHWQQTVLKWSKDWGHIHSIHGKLPILFISYITHSQNAISSEPAEALLL